MLWSRPELVALLLCAGFSLVNSGLINGKGNGASGAIGSGGSSGGSVTSVEQQLELKLNALRVHKQLLQAEIARLYMESFTPETPLLLEELQQRQQDIQLQIERLEGKAQHQDAQHLALSLTADFELLQHKLDDLKQQLDAMQHASGNQNSSSIKPTLEQQRDVINSTPKSPVGSAASNVGSYFFTPLLAMPEFPSGSIAQTAQTSPSLIKRLMAMLRPNAATSQSAGATQTASNTATSTGLRGNQWTEPSSKVQLLSAQELLPQLQLQRQFLDDAIRRLEHLAVKTKSENKV